jgi:hypothetical protein
MQELRLPGMAMLLDKTIEDAKKDSKSSTCPALFR